MPIKCPISEVLKRRRVQGREYFEVSWVEFDGLKTSIVSADLVERACPEKIAEFEEKRAQKKKQNCRKPRLKKSEDKASMANADLKLQELLRGIEYEDNARGHSFCRNTFALGTSGKQDSMISGTFPSEQYESEIPSKPSGFRHLDSSTMVEMDVIDLLSPRLKKSEDKASLANVDLKLQELLLEIESKDNARMGHSSCRSTSTLGSCSQNGHMLSGTFLDEQCKSKVTYEPTRNCHSCSPTTMEMDVIDLLSPIPGKSDDKASMTNVDLKPQELLPEFESEDKLRRRHSLCSAPTSGSSSKNDSTMLSTVLDEQDEGKITEEASSDFQSGPPPTSEVDMIDLLSPSPEPRALYVSKCQGNVEQVSVIDLSDSDVDMMSPDHAQKARELRVFLASIREDIH